VNSMVEQLFYFDFVHSLESQGWQRNSSFVVKFIQCWLPWNCTKV
jgi:hypothetical protein